MEFVSQVGGSSVASCLRAGGMPGTAFLGGTEGCAQALSYQPEVCDMKRSCSGSCSGASAEKAGGEFRVFAGM